MEIRSLSHTRIRPNELWEFLWLCCQRGFQKQLFVVWAAEMAHWVICENLSPAQKLKSWPMCPCTHVVPEPRREDRRLLGPPSLIPASAKTLSQRIRRRRQSRTPEALLWLCEHELPIPTLNLCMEAGMMGQVSSKSLKEISFCLRRVGGTIV